MCNAPSGSCHSRTSGLPISHFGSGMRSKPECQPLAREITMISLPSTRGQSSTSRRPRQPRQLMIGPFCSIEMHHCVELSLHSRKSECPDPAHAQAAIVVLGDDMLHFEVDFFAGFRKHEIGKDAKAQEPPGKPSSPAAIAPHAHAAAIHDDRAGRLQHVILHAWRKCMDRFAKRPLKRPADGCVLCKGTSRRMSYSVASMRESLSVVASEATWRFHGLNRSRL